MEGEGRKKRRKKKKKKERKDRDGENCTWRCGQTASFDGTERAARIAPMSTPLWASLSKPRRQTLHEIGKRSH